MLAISGGAPYAYASAWSMPERVEAIAVVSGAPPITELNEHDGLARFVSLDARALSRLVRNCCENVSISRDLSRRDGFRCNCARCS